MTTDTISPPRGVFSSTPVRFLVFAIVLIAAYVGVQIGVAAVAGKAPLAVMAGRATGAVVLILLYVGLVRLFERRGASELAFGRGAGLAIGGAALGFALFAAVMAILWGLGLAGWSRGGDTSKLAAMIVAAAFAAIGEELAFRGGVFRVLEEGCGSWVALVLSAALFGLLHAGNTGATPISTAAIAIEAGLLLGAAYMATRNLWLPIGLHFGWNFTEGGLFGQAVSGGQGHGVWPVVVHGPELLTGGAFGPEASVVSVAVCLVATAALLVAAARRGQWRPLRFRLQAA